jgi:hypothetical protein
MTQRAVGRKFFGGARLPNSSMAFAELSATVVRLMFEAKPLAEPLVCGIARPWF